MPGSTIPKNQIDEITGYVEESDYVHVSDDQIAAPSVTITTSAGQDFLIGSEISFVKVKQLVPQETTIFYSVGSASSEKEREIKRANEILSEGVEIEFDLSY